MVVYYAWTIVTVAIGWGLWGLATATVARSIVGTAFIVALAPTGVVWPRYDRRRIRAMLGIGLRVQAVDFVAALRDQILVLGTAAIGSVSIVAYWSLVLRALQAPQTLLLTLLRVSFPAMSRTRSAGGDPAQHVATAPGCAQRSSPARCSRRWRPHRPSCRSCLETSGHLRLTLSF